MLERFELLDRIGRGGQATTWRARDSVTGDLVALKVLHMGAVERWKEIELFEREADALRSIQHPDIPDFLDAWTQEDEGELKLYLAQEFVEGQNLAQELAARGPWSEDEAAADLRQLLEILLYLHDRVPPMIHRDVKPQNIIRRPDGRLCLVDFGAVQTTTAARVGSSTVIGTPGYMPMEQFIGQADERSDLYGVGVTMGHLLTGCDPTQITLKNNRFDFAAHMKGRPLTPWMTKLLERLSAPSREDRFPHARAALDALSTTHVTPTQTPVGDMPTRSAREFDHWFAETDPLLWAMHRRSRSFLGELLDNKYLFVDRPPAHYIKDVSQHLSHQGFTHVLHKTRFALDRATSYEVWSDPSGIFHAIFKHPIQDTEKKSYDHFTLVSVLDTGDVVAMGNLLADAEHQLRSTGNLELDLAQLRQFLHMRIDQGQLPIQGLEPGRLLALCDHNWSGLKEPVLGPEDVEENTTSWFIRLPLYAFLVLLALLAASILIWITPFIMIASLYQQWGVWRTYQKELREGRIPTRHVMTPLMPPEDESVFDFEADVHASENIEEEAHVTVSR